VSAFAAKCCILGGEVSPGRIRLWKKGANVRYYGGPAGRGRLLIVALLTAFLCELPYVVLTIILRLENTTVLVGGMVAILTVCFFAWPVILRLLENR
jgi:hypothetical protein